MEEALRLGNLEARALINKFDQAHESIASSVAGARPCPAGTPAARELIGRGDPGTSFTVRDEGTPLSPRDQRWLDDITEHERAGKQAGACESSASDRGETRGSLVTELAAERRLAIMADHLGWSEPPNFTPTAVESLSPPTRKRAAPASEDEQYGGEDVADGEGWARRREANESSPRKRSHSAEDALFRTRSRASRWGSSTPGTPVDSIRSRRRNGGRGSLGAGDCRIERMSAACPELAGWRSLVLGESDGVGGGPAMEGVAHVASCPPLPRIKCWRLNRFDEKSKGGMDFVRQDAPKSPMRAVRR